MNVSDPEEILHHRSVSPAGVPSAGASSTFPTGAASPSGVSDVRQAGAAGGRMRPQRSMARPDARPVEWCVHEGPVGYEDAVAAMERRAEAIARGEAEERVWLLEHPPLYTAGTSTRAVGDGLRFPVHRTGRGGQMTYHGPGQRVAYVMLDLRAREPDVRAFVASLERWIIDTLAAFAIRGERREDRVGVWVARPDRSRGPGGTIAEDEIAEDKIAAIGIRVRRWVSFHGISLNVGPDLSHYADITPCGIADARFGVTSLADLGHAVTPAEVDAALRASFEVAFGPTRLVAS